MRWFAHGMAWVTALWLAVPVAHCAVEAGEGSGAIVRLPDADGDGFSDERERRDGTDPNSRDSFGANGLAGVDSKGVETTGWVRFYAPRVTASHLAGDETAQVCVACSADRWQARVPLHMELDDKGAATGYWSGGVPGLAPGVQYKYVVRGKDAGGEKWVADPRARILHNGNAVVVDPSSFQWQHGGYSDSTFEIPELGDLLVYEIHTGSATLRDGKYGTFADLLDASKGIDLDGDGRGELSKIDWVRRMGFNTIEIMPVLECATSPYTLGFNPHTFFALNRNHLGPGGSPDVFRRFVLECHKRGLAVVMDVNVNHVDDSYFPGAADASMARRCAGNYTSPLFQIDFRNHPDQPNNDFGWMFMPYDSARETGQWYEVAWGPAVNYTGAVPGGNYAPLKSAVQGYALDSLIMWAREYHVDGLRFDAVYSIGPNGPTAVEGREFVAEFNRRKGKLKKGFVTFCENTFSVRAMQDALGMDANWPNPNGWEQGRDDSYGVLPNLCGAPPDAQALDAGIHGMMFSHVQVQDVAAWSTHEPDSYTRYPSLSNLSCHNTANDLGTTYHRVASAAQGKSVSWIRKRAAMVQSMAWLGTAVPYVFMGDELMDGRYRSDGRGKLGNAKDWDDSGALPWELAGSRYNIAMMWRELASMRRQLPAFRVKLPCSEGAGHRQLPREDASDARVVIHRWVQASSDGDVLIVMNFGDEQRVGIGAPKSGTWTEVFSTDWFRPDEDIRASGFRKPPAKSHVTTDTPCQGCPYRLPMVAPANSVTVLSLKSIAAQRE